MYYLWFVICDPDLSGATVEGSTVWKNPTGGTSRKLHMPCRAAQLLHAPSLIHIQQHVAGRPARLAQAGACSQCCSWITSSILNVSGAVQTVCAWCRSCVCQES